MKPPACVISKPKDGPQKRKKRNHSQRNRTASRARMIRELDALARAEVFERDGNVCIMCHKKDRAVQWAHVLSRRHPCLRWVADNAMTLCAGCHMFWHHEPAMAVEWFMKNFADRWTRIKCVLLANPKVNVRQLWEMRGEKQA